MIKIDDRFCKEYNNVIEEEYNKIAKKYDAIYVSNYQLFKNFAHDTKSTFVGIINIIKTNKFCLLE